MQLGMIAVASFLKNGTLPELMGGSKEEGLESIMKFPVHDEINGMSPKHELDWVVQNIKDILEGVVEISVPTPVEIKVGPNWGEIEEYEKWQEKNMAVT